MILRGISIISAFILIVTLSACGGGGGGGGNSTVNYTGPTAIAAITNDNAGVITNGFLVSSSSGVAASDNPLLSGVVTNTTSSPAIMNLAHTLNRVLPLVQASTGTTSNAIGVVVSETGSINGFNGGSFNYSFTFDDQTGEFSGTFSFSNFNDGLGALNGNFSVTGTLDLGSLTLTTGTLIFTSITVSDTFGTITMGGTISINVSGLNSSNMTMTMNFISGNMQYRIENLQVSVTNMGTYDIVNSTGRFFHSSFGYVDVSANNLNIMYGADYPYSGTLLLSGSNNTAALVTFTSATTYTLQINADGVGGYETSASCTWGGTCIIAAAM